MPSKERAKRRILTRGVSSVEKGREIASKTKLGRRRLTDKMTRLTRETAIAPVTTTMKLKHKRGTEPTLHKADGPEAWANATTELGIRGIRREFLNEIKGFVPVGTVTAWEAEKNYDKNRFEDIRLLDKTRVILKQTPDNDDYIHASYVHVTDEITFICAQGPLPNTVEHFWIMVVQEGAKVVLQLCQNSENGKEQCAEYFPQSGSKDFGSVHVEVAEKPTNIVSLKKVIRTKLSVSYVGSKCEVLHFLYGGWPDHCVADSPTVCRDVRKLILKYYDKKPIVVHCSAGIGRTGAFVASEMAIQKLKKNEVVVVSEVVKNLREQRMGAIQNDQQYLFVFRMTMEVLLSEDLLSKDQQIVNFLNEYEELIKRKKAERAKKAAKT